MLAYTRKELVGSAELAKGLGGFLDWVVSSPFHKLAIMRRNKPEVVMLPIEEYERIVSMSEAYENEQIAKIIQKRVTNKKAPAKMISHEEMIERLRKRGKDV